MKTLIQHSHKILLSSILIMTSILIKAQVPILNSISNAGPTTPTIFLDFDGHNVIGTSWNITPTITCLSSGLNTTQITEVFNRVAEDYRPFTVNITTDSMKYQNAPITQRMRVVLTPTWQWYCGATACAGGVAYTGSFAWGDNTPCFVFTLGALGLNIKNIGEAAAHEAGHTLGLYHQSSYDVNCVKTSDYNYGQGTGEIGWAPIMGVGYYQNLSIWHNGPNSYGCTSYQDDKVVITSTTNGITYKNDDYFNTTGSAYQPLFTGQLFSQSGIIEQSTDKDMFKFVCSTAGTLHVDGVPYNVGAGNSGADLDIQLRLLDGSGNQLAIYNPATLLNATIDTALNAGTYFIEVDGIGNTYTTDYGVLGSYTLSGNYSGTVDPPSACQSMVVTDVVTPDNGSGNGAVNITVTGTSNPLTYLWSNSATTQDISNVWDGSYTVTINNAIGGCSITRTYAIPLSTNCSTILTQNTLSTFETGLDQWNHVASTMYWTQWTGTVPTPNTGPISGAYQGSYYMYIEATNNKNKTAILESNCVNLRNATSPSLGFYYSMRGADIGTLSWGVTPLGGTYTQLGILTGAQNSGNWTLKNQSLSAYIGKIVRLRIIGTTKVKDKGDIAIDAVSINTSASAITTSLADEKYWNDGLVLYPNPTEGKFNVVFQKEELLNQITISVYTITGQKVKEFTNDNIGTTSFEQEINLEEFTNGMYIVNININKEKTYTYKVVKNAK